MTYMDMYENFLPQEEETLKSAEEAAREEGADFLGEPEPHHPHLQWRWDRFYAELPWWVRRAIGIR